MKSTTETHDWTARQIRMLAGAAFEEDDVVEVRTIHPTTGGVRRLYACAGDLHERVGWILARNGEGLGVYIGACPRPAWGASGDASIELARCVWADFDGCDRVEALRRIADAGLPPPTVLIASGGGVHAWWRLVDPMSDMAMHRDLQRRIARATGSDPSVCNAERVLRLPGTRNTKPARSGARCEIIGLVRSRVADASAFSALPPVDPPRPTRRAAVAGPIGDDRAEAAWALLDRIDPALLDHGDWLRASGAARLEGVGFDRWDSWCARDGSRYTPEANARRWATLRREGSSAAGLGTLFYLVDRQRPGQAALVLRAVGAKGVAA